MSCYPSMSHFKAPGKTIYLYLLKTGEQFNNWVTRQGRPFLELIDLMEKII